MERLRSAGHVFAVIFLAGVVSVSACVSDAPASGETVDGGSDAGTVGDGGGGDGGDGSTKGDGAVATAPPTHAASAVAFVDIDPRTGTVGGVVRITKAADESDVADYAIYAADDSGAKKSGTPLGMVNATGKNVVFALPDGTTIDTGVTKLLVLSQNAAGEMSTGPTTDYHDAVVHAVALTPVNATSTIGNGIGVALDVTNNKIVVASTEVLYHCNLDGTSCVSGFLASSQQYVGPTNPLLVPSTSNMVLAASAYSNFNAVAVTSTLDGASPAVTAVSSTSTTNTGSGVGALLDTGRSRLVIAVYDSSTSGGGHSVLYDCAYDGSGCTQRSIAAGTSQPSQGGQYPSIALDPINHNYIVATKTASTVYALVCPTSSGSCTGHDNITGSGSVATNHPRALIDTINQKLVVAAFDSTHSPVLTNCALDATGCTAPVEMTTGTGVGEKPISYDFDAVLEPNAQKVVAAGTVGGFPVLFRCNPDATGCEFSDFGQTTGTWYSVSLTTDPESGQPYVVASESATNNPPWLFTMY